MLCKKEPWEISKKRRTMKAMLKLIWQLCAEQTEEGTSKYDKTSEEAVVQGWGDERRRKK